MEKVRIGIIGIGTMGSNHANWIHEGKVNNAVLAAVCDIDPSRRQWAKENLDASVVFFQDAIELMESGLVDAVIIATPHYLHPELGIEALNRDLHVLVEKPAGVYTQKVRELNELSEKKENLVFGMMFNQRMNPLYQKVKSLMEEGIIGEIQKLSWVITSWWRPQKYYDQSSWRATWEGEGGGVLANQAPHQIDLLQWICGMPSSVYANLSYGSHRKISVEDDVTAVLTYPNGAKGVFVTCTYDVLGTDRFEILGDSGKIIIENSKKVIIKKLKESEPQMNEYMTFKDVQRLVRGGGMKDVYTEETFEIPDQWGIQHQQVSTNFVDCIINGTKLIAPGKEGIKGLTLVNAMYLSSWLNKEVSIPFDEELFIEELNKKIKEEKGK